MTKTEPLFWIKDKKTGQEADLSEVVLESYRAKTWARHLVYCDLEDWLIDQEGNIVAADECGNFAYAPFKRFEVIWNRSPLAQNPVEWPHELITISDGLTKDEIKTAKEKCILANDMRRLCIAAYDKAQSLSSKWAQKGKEEMDKNAEELGKALFGEAQSAQKAEPCASCGRKSESLSSGICPKCLDLGITWKDSMQKPGGG